MNRVKSGACASKKCDPSRALKNDLNLEEKIEKLSVKPKSVNGLLVNGIGRKSETRKSEEPRPPDVGKVSDDAPRDSDLDASGLCDLVEANCDLSDKSGTKSKGKSKRTDSERSSVASTSTSGGSCSRIESRYKLDESHMSDFDISAYIKGKYGDRKEEERDFERPPFDIVSEKQSSVGLAMGPEETVPLVESPEIQYVQYDSELQMPMIMKIIQKDLSEPYSIYTYRYFIHNWPNLCFLAMCDDECVGAIVCKLDLHRKLIRRGYIAMLAVDKRFRKHGIGSTLVRRAIEEMVAGSADEVVLETEITNRPALRLYEALGFVRDKRLFRYYLNGVDALRLKLWLR